MNGSIEEITPEVSEDMSQMIQMHNDLSNGYKFAEASELFETIGRLAKQMDIALSKDFSSDMNTELEKQIGDKDQTTIFAQNLVMIAVTHASTLQIPEIARKLTHNIDLLLADRIHRRIFMASSMKMMSEILAKTENSTSIIDGHELQTGGNVQNAAISVYEYFQAQRAPKLNEWVRGEFLNN